MQNTTLPPSGRITGSTRGASPSHGRRGWVALVGAGPGDPELLTLKAARRIGEADVILVDDLVDARVLAHARPTARIRRVGKRGGCRSTPQRFIEALMIREARAGHGVVRLKGGDPLVFGRAGEEIAALGRAGIDVEIVNGVSSALAAGAALGRSLTHRDHAQGVAFVTGRPKPGGAEPDWRALAASGMTLAIYMGLGRAAGVRDALLGGGLDPDTPAAIVERASGPGERVLETRLGAMAEDFAASGFASPALILVGEALRAPAALGARAEAFTRPSPGPRSFAAG